MVAKSNPFIISENEDTENEDTSELNLVNLVTNRIMPASIQRDILDVETRGNEAFVTHVKERVNGEKNMWDKMSKLKYLTWKDGCKTVNLKAESEVVSLKATNSLFVRLLLIAKSSRELDLEGIVGKHEFASCNATLMKPDGSLLPSNNKSILIHELEHMAATSQTGEELTNQRSLTSIIIDGMAVVQEMVVYKSQIKTCRDLLDCFVRSIDSKSVGYIDAYVVFDNYSINNSLKDRTRERRTAGKTQDKGYKVDDTTRIKDFKSFLSTKETKANLVLYLAQKAVQLCKVPITTHTEKGVFSSQPNMVNIPSTQEEADTLLFLYAVAVSRQGNTVHIYSCDTDVLVLALRRVPDLKPNSVIIMGTGDRRRQIKLKPIYVALGAERAAALPGFHALTGSDTTGHIKGKGKSSCFKVFMKADEDVICTLAGLGVGVYPSPGVLSGCEVFVPAVQLRVYISQGTEVAHIQEAEGSPRCGEAISNSGMYY